jgi:hypothetical protein
MKGRIMIELTAAQAATWQTAPAIVQAVCSVGLLAWYALAAHLERSRTRREKADEFDSLVRLCRDLGVDAKDKTKAHMRALSMPMEAHPVTIEPSKRLELWRADMTIIYVCLNEVPHYEVRNPAFSIALTRLWLEVDARNVSAGDATTAQQLLALLSQKIDRICLEIDAMASLLEAPDRTQVRGRLSGKAKRRGYRYSAEGFPEQGAALR